MTQQIKMKVEATERVKGTLRYWNPQRGYGVVRSNPDECGMWREFFLHATRIISGEPVAGSFADFSIGLKPPGRSLPNALDCKLSAKVELPESLIATLAAVQR